MQDNFNITDTSENNQVFFSNGGIWQIWSKPNNVKFIHFYMLGGGGGGGGGRATSVTSRTGGGGGGSSSISSGIFFANLLPDILYIQVGIGGSGGTSTLNGSSGTVSYVSIQPNTTTSNVVLVSGKAGDGGGQSAGTAGIAGTIFTKGNGLLS
jgi:hypothetical protein